MLLIGCLACSKGFIAGEGTLEKTVADSGISSISNTRDTCRSKIRFMGPLDRSSTREHTDPDYQIWSDFLRRYLDTSNSDGIHRVDYAGVTAEDREGLKQYLLRLQKIPVSRLSRIQQLPYWINLYNAFTVHLILEHYPLDSIVDIRYGFFDFGPWDEKLLQIEDEEVSLNDIEHRILRPIWKDPRLHYVLNCASLGCPNLQPESFHPGNVESLLNSGAHNYINHPRGLRFENDDDLLLSKIYDWYADDFGDNEKELLQHLIRNANRSTKTRLESFDGDIDYEYDWDLNALSR